MISHDSKRGMRVTVACGNRARSSMGGLRITPQDKTRRAPQPISRKVPYLVTTAQRGAHPDACMLAKSEQERQGRC